MCKALRTLSAEVHRNTQQPTDEMDEIFEEELTDAEIAALKRFSDRTGCKMVKRTLEEMLDDV